MEVEDLINKQNDEEQSKTQNNQIRISSRLRRSNQKKIENMNLIDKILNLSNDLSISEDIDLKTEEIHNKIEVADSPQTSNSRRMHSCEKCGLEFTSANSVFRHQEKSCLRVKVINIKSTKSLSNKVLLTKKKCPICAAVFFNTHRVSIHIYKHHRNLLGSASLPASNEAKRLNEMQLSKTTDPLSSNYYSESEKQEFQ